MLNIANGDLVNGKFTAKDNLLGHLLSKNLPPAKLVEEIYLTAFSRRPTAKETSVMTDALTSAMDAQAKRQAAEDILFALISSKEFLFNH